MADITLIIPAWQRPGYFGRALASWRKARGFDGLRAVAVALAPSPLAAAMRRIAGDAEIWPDSVTARRVHGPHTAIGEAVCRAFEDPGCRFAVVSDEDQVVSDDILDYIAFCRTLDVEAVNCHNNLGQGWSPQWDDSDAGQSLVLLEHEFSGYTWGVSRETWERTWLPAWDWDCTSGTSPVQHGFDWQMHRVAAAHLLAMPEASRCQNIGQYGGVYADPAKFTLTLAKSFREHRDPIYIAKEPDADSSPAGEQADPDGGRDGVQRRARQGHDRQSGTRKSH